MNRFRIIKPTAVLASYVEEYWLVSANNIEEGFQRLIPIGCVGITFNRNQSAFSVTDSNFYPQSYVSGQMTFYSDLRYSVMFDFVCVIFKPAGAMRFFKIPISDFYNQYVSVEYLNDMRLKEIEDKVIDARSDDECVRFIELFLIKQASGLGADNFDRLSSVIKRIHNNELNDVASLAKEACLGYKQFYRIFTDGIGIHPNNYLRIFRLKRLLSLLRFKPFMTLTELAFECGYYDKSHLLRDLKQFTGFDTSQYLSRCDLFSTSYPLFHSAFIDLK